MKEKLLIFGLVLAVLIVLGVIIFLIPTLYSPPSLSNPKSIGNINNQAPEFSFTANKAGTISYFGDCSSSITSAKRGVNTITFNRLVEGNHNNCYIILTDSEGKQSPQLSVPSFTIDITKPVTTANSNGYINGEFAKNVTINFECTDISGTGCNGNPYYKINNGSKQQNSSVTFATDGIYSLEYWSVDNAGNEESHHTEFNSIKIDSEGIPSPLITTPAGYENQSFDLTYTPTNSKDNCAYSVDDGPSSAYGLCSGTFSSITLYGEGSHDLVVYENDSVGDAGSSGPVRIIWDTIPPEITITSPVAGNYNETTWPGVVLGNYEDTTTCQYSSDETNWYNFNSCSDTANYNVTAGTLYVRGIDEAGNAGNDTSVTFTYS
jgi:hypothetical protein